MIILNSIEKLNCDTVITIGNFDGVHIGHRKLIEETKIMAKETNAKSLVFSFCPHTVQILKDPSFKTIFTNTERRLIFKNLDIDYLLEYQFNKTNAKTKSIDFLKLITKNLNCRGLVLGNDYKFGSDNTKNILEKSFSSLLIKKMSYIITDEKNKLSSTYIRSLITEKKFSVAEKFLNGKYFIMNKIMYEKKYSNASHIINFISSKNKLLPPDGLYETTTLIQNKKYKSITIVRNKFCIVQTHILNFSKNIYDQTAIAIVYFNKFICNTTKFDLFSR